MLTTEHEASCNTCHKLLEAELNGANHVQCRGSDCMAWRWAPSAVAHVEAGRVPVGYCGLAGGIPEVLP